MNKQVITERMHLIMQEIARVESGIVQMQASLNMLHGGRQECMYFLQEIEKKEAAEAEVKKLAEDDGSVAA